MTTTPRIVAVLVNFNRRELLLGAIASLHRQTCAVAETIVVDNGSTDGSAAAVAALGDSRIRILALPGNLGSAGGFARGIAEALRGDADQLLVLDSDVELAADCVALLAAHLRAHPATTVAGPKVLLWDHPSVLQEFGGWIDWDGADLRRSHWRHDETKDGPVPATQNVDYVPACGMLAARAAFADGRGFAADWFLYWDDIDWCHRVRAAGQNIAVVAAAQLRHFGGGANKRNLVPVYYGWRNRLAFFRTRTPATLRPAALAAFSEDFLLARFTCRALGLTRTAAVMSLGVDDALAGTVGRKDFAGVELELDAPPAPAVVPGANLEAVHHVIGSATAELAARRGLWLRDRFGKCLRADHAWRLHEEYRDVRAREFGPLLAAASSSGALAGAHP